MKLIVCSDIHDNIWALQRALDGLSSEGATLLFCGDFCAPFTLVQLAEGFAGPIHIVWGNNDGDKFLLTQQASRFAHVALHGEIAEFDCAGRRILANHYPPIARRLAESASADIVCYGHDHIAHEVVLANGVLLLNPGEIMGRFGRSTYHIIDLMSMRGESVEVPSS